TGHGGAPGRPDPSGPHAGQARTRTTGPEAPPLHAAAHAAHPDPEAPQHRAPNPDATPNPPHRPHGHGAPRHPPTPRKINHRPPAPPPRRPRSRPGIRALQRRADQLTPRWRRARPPAAAPRGPSLRPADGCALRVTEVASRCWGPVTRWATYWRSDL